MDKIIFSLEQVRELVSENRYKVNDKTKFLSRCIDGRYKNDEDLPALAFPGADVGELALIFATANSYGFEVNKENLLKSFLEVIGGEKNFRLHTDNHADQTLAAGGCGHFKQIKLDPQAYNLQPNQIDFIQKSINKYHQSLVNNTILHGDHLEGAVLFIKGSWGVYPQYQIETNQGKKLTEVFIYHQTLVDERHKKLAKELINKKAIIFKNNEDEEWLYNALSDVSENHLMETAKRLAKGLPIFSVTFTDDGSFKIKEEGVF